MGTGLLVFFPGKDIRSQGLMFSKNAWESLNEIGSYGFVISWQKFRQMASPL
jgi:hypothetical protein